MKILTSQRPIVWIGIGFLVLLVMIPGCFLSDNSHDDHASLSSDTNPSYVYPVFDYYYGEWQWYFDISVSETGGVGVTLQEITIAFYDLNGTFIYEADYSDQIFPWFGTDWINHNGTVRYTGNYWSNDNGSGAGWQAVFTFSGFDEYDNYVSTDCGVTCANS